jgi:MAP/microtubule affinity-regulating kinase
LFPCTVKLFEVIETDKTLYLVMEYCSGGEVFDYLVAHGRMKEKEARIKFRQIVSSVQYCHQKHVIHRDLKAENLLLDGDMNIKIADFGFSNEFTPGNKLDTFCGSPPYAAPELFQGKKYDGPEVDVWSLGVILYTLVSGSLPFDGQNLKELRERVLRGKYRIPFYMSTDCENLLKKLLVLNPSKRATLEHIMLDKWMNIGFEGEELKPYIEPAPDINDNQRVQKMTEMGFSLKEIQESLSENKYDEVCATYYLLGKETSQSREVSTSSLSSSLKPMNGNVDSGISSQSSQSQGASGGSGSQHHSSSSGSSSKRPSVPNPVTPVGGAQQHAKYAGRSFSMRNPGQGRRQSDIGYHPSHAKTHDENGGETTVQPSPLTLQEKGSANNPNQADIPTPRKKAYEYPHAHSQPTQGSPPNSRRYSYVGDSLINPSPGSDKKTSTISSPPETASKKETGVPKSISRSKSASNNPNNPVRLSLPPIDDPEEFRPTTAPSHHNPDSLLPNSQFPHHHQQHLSGGNAGFSRNVPTRSTFSHPVRRVTHSEGMTVSSHASNNSRTSFFGRLALKFSRR